MQPETVICESRAADAALCGETALVHVVHYVYGLEPDAGREASKHVLRETRYDIECPRCGRRTQIVRH
jgi:hypothetical protein